MQDRGRYNAETHVLVWWRGAFCRRLCMYEADRFPLEERKAFIYNETKDRINKRGEKGDKYSQVL